MSGSIFTTDAGQGQGLGTSPGHSGVHLNAARRREAGTPVDSWRWLLEDATGYFRLEDDSGDFELEAGP
jgi:hypothetical protein